MKKLAIPAILVATIMVAGIFAFVSAEQASTTHLSGSSAAIRDTVTFPFTANHQIASGDHYVFMDMAGIGGIADVEVVWRIADTNCDPATLTGSTVTDLVPDGAFDGVDATLLHDDATGVDAVLVVADSTSCFFQTNDFITVSVVGTD